MVVDVGTYNNHYFLLTVVLFIIVPVHYNYRNYPISASVAFHIKTSQLICTANQLTGFYMKCNTRLKWVKLDLGWLCKHYSNGYIYLYTFVTTLFPFAGSASENVMKASK